MIEEFRDKQKRQGDKMSSIMDYTMGIILFCFGAFFLVYRHFDIRIMNKEPSGLDYVIGGIFVIYGGWRFYRGYQKNQNK